MTSSTSGSEAPRPGLGTRVVAVLLPLLVLAAGVAGIRAEPVLDERAGRAVQPLVEAEDVGVIGNSVAASLGEEALVEALSRAAGREVEVGNAAVPGAFPAHWTAGLAQAARRAGRLPAVVLTYVPAENLLATELVDPTDRESLAALDPGRVPGLVDRALGGAPPSRGVLPGRVPLRGAVIEAASRGLAAALWPGVDEVLLTRSLDRLQGPMAARTGAGGFLEVPSALPSERAAPRAASPGASILPLLADAVAGAGSRLVVVVPVELDGPPPPPCGQRRAALPEGVAFLADRGADVVDLRGLRTTPAEHQTRHHLSAAGQAVVGAALAEALGALGWPGPDEGGRLWSPDCGGGSR